MVLVTAVNVWSSVGVPLIVTDPVGSSFTLATLLVAELVTLSAVPCSSV